MRDATFAEPRNHAKDYFDAVEGGDTVRVFRNGKPIAEIIAGRKPEIDIAPFNAARFRGA